MHSAAPAPPPNVEYIFVPWHVLGPGHRSLPSAAHRPARERVLVAMRQRPDGSLQDWVVGLHRYPQRLWPLVQRSLFAACAAHPPDAANLIEAEDW